VLKVQETEKAAKVQERAVELENFHCLFNCLKIRSFL
jgi:hypothetical protein